MLLEEGSSVPNTVNVGIVPTVAPLDDNINNGVGVTMVPQATSVVNDFLGGVSNVLETVGGVVKQGTEIYQQVTGGNTPPPVTTPVTPPPHGTNFGPYLIIGGVIVAALLILK